MSEYRDRLLGFLKSHAPSTREDLFGAEVAPPPSCRPEDGSDLQARFRDELEGVGGEVIFLAQIDDPEAAVRDWFAGVGSGKVALDADPAWKSVTLPFRDLVEQAGLEIQEVDGSTTSADLADTEIGVTIADIAVAETGSIGQCSRPFRPRSLSLVPPRHLTLIPADRIVPGLEDFFAGVTGGAPWAGGADAFSSYFTWITGPSRTADIEKTLTIGIHGPGHQTVMFLPHGVDG